ncbi:acyl carrier protein [Rhodococcus sovatensis]|uniref:Acyl carrier protein n=1 Tax=Rhodococcus sovatensis TaxID=1805840 RepID=A0ABZ2PNB5_9NOCA
MSREKIVAYLKDAIENRLENVDLPDDPVEAGTRFDELGLDSLNLVELALLVERDLTVVVTDEELANLETVSAAAEHISTSIDDGAPTAAVQG